MTNEELVQEIQSGVNIQANMEQLYLQVKWLIHKVAWNRVSMFEEDDLMQEGFFGLHKAVQHYNPDSGVLFISYAENWIRQAITIYCDHNRSLRRIPKSMGADIRRFNSFCEDHLSQHGTDPEDGEICEALKISTDKLNLIRRCIEDAGSVSMEAPIQGMEGDDLTVGDTIPDDFDLEDYVIEQEENRKHYPLIWQQVKTLPEQQQDVIIQVYKEGQSLKDVAAGMGVKYDTLRARERKALKNLHEDEQLQQIALERGMGVDSVAYRGGVKRFRYTGMSATEEAVFRKIQDEKRREKQNERQRQLTIARKAITDRLKADPEQFRQDVQGLPEEERDIVMKHIIDGLTYRDIATEYGCSKSKIIRIETDALLKLDGQQVDEDDHERW